MDLKSLVSTGFPKIHILNYQLEIYLKLHMKDAVEKLVLKYVSLYILITRFFRVALVWKLVTLLHNGLLQCSLMIYQSIQ